jgi:small subunit ribosomal protein S8
LLSGPCPQRGNTRIGEGQLVNKTMDSIADAITIIRNGYLARKKSVSIPSSRLKKQIVEKLLLLGFIEELKVDEKEKKLIISLRYQDGEPALHAIERLSKPSLRIYSQAGKIPKVLGGRGDVILSTPKGILTGAEAKKARVGGELLIKVW